MPVDLKNAILIPQKSTFEILDKKYVFVVDENGTVSSREITTGAEIPHIYQVISGLNEKDRIIFEGLRKVKNGQKVEFEFHEQTQLWKEFTELHAE